MSIGITGIGAVTSSAMGCGRDLDSLDMTGVLPELPLSGLGPNARRMDTYSKLGMTALSFALKDAGLLEWSQKRPIGIIAAGEYACLETDLAYFDTVTEGGASPGLFTYTLPSVFLGEAQILFGLTGPAYVVNGNSPLDITPLALAMESMEDGESDAMVCGIVNPPRPAVLTDSRNLPEASLFFLLERLSPGKTSYGTLCFNGRGAIEYEGTVVQDLFQLLHRCLGVSAGKL